MSDQTPIRNAFDPSTPSPPIPWIFELAAEIERVDRARFYSDPGTMERAIRNALDLFDLHVAIAPFDTALEAEALGCETASVDGRPEVIAGTVSSVDDAFDVPIADVSGRGRVPMATDVVERLASDPAVGDLVAGVTGPQMLRVQLVDGDPGEETITETLWTAGDAIVEIVRGYFEAGADAIAIVEPDVPDTIESHSDYRDALDPIVNVAGHYDRPTLFLTETLTPELVETVADLGFDAAVGNPESSGGAEITESGADIAFGFGVPQAAFAEGGDELLQYRETAAPFAFTSSQLQVPPETAIDTVNEFLDSF